MLWRAYFVSDKLDAILSHHFSKLWKSCQPQIHVCLRPPLLLICERMETSLSLMRLFGLIESTTEAPTHQSFEDALRTTGHIIAPRANFGATHLLCPCMQLAPGLILVRRLVGHPKVWAPVECLRSDNASLASSSCIICFFVLLRHWCFCCTTGASSFSAPVLCRARAR